MRKMVISYEAIETYSIPDDIDDMDIRVMRRFCADRIDQVEAFLEKNEIFLDKANSKIIEIDEEDYE